MKITENDGKFWLKSKEVEQVYHDLTIELMINTIKRLKQRGNADLLRNPYVWQLEKLNDMHLLTEENVQTIAKYSDISERLFRDVIANEGFEIYKHGHEQLAKALETTANINYGLQKSLDAMARQTMYETNNLINTSLPPALQKGFKQALEKAVGAVVGGISDEKKALTKAVFEMFDNGFTAFVDRGGRTWTAERYAQTVIRTTTFRTYRELREEPAKEFDIDTYYYSIKSSAREMCAPLQHRIVTKGVARTIKGERVLSLPDYGLGTPGGCLGINCGHYLTPFVIGVNYKPSLPEHLENLTEEEAKQNALDKAKLKSYERAIKKVRDNKKIAKALDNTELYDKLKLREKTLRASKKALIEKNPTVIGKYPPRVVGNTPEKVYNRVKKDYKVLEDSQIEKLQKSSDTLYKKLTAKELKSLKYYTQGGYQQINDYLTGDEYYNRGEDAKNISTAISKFKLDKDLITYRGTKAKYFKELKEGDVFSGKVFYSTSLSRSQAMEFYTDIRDYYEEEARFLEIRVPKNTEVLYVGKNTNFKVDEKELLLSNKLKYKIKEIKGDNMVLEVYEDEEKETKRKRV